MVFRITESKTRSYNESTGKFYPSLENADIYTMTDGVLLFVIFQDVKQSIHVQDGRFLHHFIKEPISEESTMTPSEAVALQIYEWCVLYGVHDTLQVIGGDSTNSNKG